MTVELVPFEAAHLDAAAEVLARRQAWLRQTDASLPDAFTRPDAARPLLEAELGCKEAHGVVAILDRRLVAYLVGSPRYDQVWNRAVWSPIAASAVDPETDRDVMRDVYAEWAEHWVRRGIFLHYVHAPASDVDLLEAWSVLNFGKMQAHATRDLSVPLSGDAAGIEIRRIGPEDAKRVEPLFDLIARQHVDTPTYAVTLPERYDAFPADYAEDIADPGSRYWAAFDGDTAVGLAGFGDADPGPMVPDGAWELGTAMTAPHARGRGVQRALLAAGFEAARQAGATYSITDWRTANLLSSRVWPKLGYRPNHFRLHRSIDARVAWARPRE
jgi:GNAT superfamily N-acetyltransferase